MILYWPLGSFHNELCPLESAATFHRMITLTILSGAWTAIIDPRLLWLLVLYLLEVNIIRLDADVAAAASNDDI